MSLLLLFGLVFLSHFNGGFNTPLPPPSYGDHVSILSIDGGGIRGIIPATVLDYLDKALKVKDPRTSLADYFDVISGTSTGGLMTLMLAAPNSSHSHQPLFTPSEVVQFYKKNGPEIFRRQHLITCPKYDGEFLKRKTVELLRETRLNETLTNVVIPTFDEKKIQPVIFSNYKLKTESYLNAKLSDIGLGTSAAPTYLPSHQFQNDGVQFDLIDGGLAANNPALVAVSEVIQNNGEKEILMLSLGTGIPKSKEKLGGIFDIGCQAAWLPFHIDVISEVAFSTDMTRYYLATIFPGLLPAKNYLRIEEYNLPPSLQALDNTDKKNMDNLEKMGKGLLTQKVKRMNVNTFQPFELDHTNAQALDRLAEKVFAERQLRLKRKSMEKGGRPLVETVQVLSD
ncbi:hypothetical protein VIGAN_09014200 [Vigna angularis var. angularis]|uniref:Patatin n=1 Tax=Vigna angularis var. angularis TaxID=157739 RepID=A0A0S3SVI5_PHAAN|nr:patatin-like protein 3 [Vigna angularis]BAT96835.1 hypothetical protein VIGAN_09014200 [Vigna angularis var. angularis]